MLERSSRRSLAVAALGAAATITTTAACNKKPAKPEADPAVVKALAAKTIDNVPAPAAARDCEPKDLVGGARLTFRTVLEIAGQPIRKDPEHAEWINPPALDSPAARVLVDPKSDRTARRQAAAELLAAPFWIVYKVDHVNAPMALGVKELKIGTVGTRVIRYEKTGIAGCVQVFYFQNDKKVSDDAIAKSDKAIIDPAIAKLLRDDLTARFVKLAPGGPGSSASPPPAKP